MQKAITFDKEKNDKKMLKDLSFLSLQQKQLEKLISKYETFEKFMQIEDTVRNGAKFKSNNQNTNFEILGYIDSFGTDSMMEKDESVSGA